MYQNYNNYSQILLNSQQAAQGRNLCTVGLFWRGQRAFATNRNGGCNQGKGQGHVTDGDDEEGKQVGVALTKVGLVHGVPRHRLEILVDVDAAHDQPAGAEYGSQRVEDPESLQQALHYGHLLGRGLRRRKVRPFPGVRRAPLFHQGYEGLGHQEPHNEQGHAGGSGDWNEERIFLLVWSHCIVVNFEVN